MMSWRDTATTWVEKPFFVIFLYCVFLWVTNWSYHMVGEDGTSTLIDMRRMSFSTGMLLSIFFAFKIWKSVRKLLDENVRIPAQQSLVRGWENLLLLLPLGIGFQNKYVIESGKLTFQYGGVGDWTGIFFAAMAIMLYQLWFRLDKECHSPPKRKLSHPRH
nr:hypothetical protein [Oscillatoria laete-virens]